MLYLVVFFQSSKKHDFYKTIPAGSGLVSVHTADTGLSRHTGNPQRPSVASGALQLHGCASPGQRPGGYGSIRRTDVRARRRVILGWRPHRHAARKTQQAPCGARADGVKHAYRQRATIADATPYQTSVKRVQKPRQESAWEEESERSCHLVLCSMSGVDLHRKPTSRGPF